MQEDATLLLKEFMDNKSAKKENNRELVRTLIVNNLLSIVFNFIVIAITVAAVFVVAIPLGMGLGAEFLAILIAPIMYISVGYIFLKPTQKYLGASVIGTMILMTIISVLAYMQNSIGRDELLFLMLPGTVLMPALCMYLGLRKKARESG